MTRRRLQPVVLIFLAASCSGEAPRPVRGGQPKVDAGDVIRISSKEPAWKTPATAWHLADARRFGTPGELIDPSALAVDGSGRVYVSDTKPAVVRVYDAGGAMVRTIGREGRGPGEFQMAVVTVRGARVVVHDPMLRRTSVFDTAGGLLGSWASGCCWIGAIHVDRADRIYIPIVDWPGRPGPTPGRIFLRFSMAGVPIDTLLIPYPPGSTGRWEFHGTGTMANLPAESMPIPFAPQVAFGFHPDSGFVHGWSGAYSLVRSPNGSDTAWIAERRWTPAALATSRRQASYDSSMASTRSNVSRATAQLSDVPTTAPAFNAITVDGAGYIWVQQVPGPDADHTEFDVFDPEGRWLGPVTAPIRVPGYVPRVIAGDGLYILASGADDQPMVIRYRIVRPVH